MKKLLRFLFVAVVGLSVLSCYDDSALREAIDKHEQMLMDLQDRCAEMNADIESLHTLIAAVQNADYITSITPITEGGKEVGYTIVFAKYGTVTIRNGADGAKGEDGAPSDAVPVIGAKQDTDGMYYWTVDGEWLTDDAGNKVPASGKDGADGEKGDQDAPGAPGADGSAGAPGVDGVTPELKIEQDYWYVSYDGGKTWTQLGRATGEDGKDGANGGDSIFKDVYEKDGYVYFVLSDGTTYKVPMTATAAPAALDITFDVESEMFVVPDEEYMIPYTIIGADEKTSVRVITNPSYVSAYVIPETSSTGSISVRVAPNYGWESEEFYQSQLSFMVTVMDGRGNSVVKAVNLKKGILSLYDSAYTVDKEGGQLSVLVKTNMEYEVVVQSEVTWLSYSPKTKSEIRTDELLFNVQPNEEKTSRNTEVYLVDNDGNHLESIYIYQRGNGGSVVIDGDFSDWGQLDSCDVVVSTCAPDAYKNGLKTMMAFADGENLNVYLEMDFDVVVDREEWNGNPVDIYLSYSPDTGGYDCWSDMCVDYMLELFPLTYDSTYCSFDEWTSLYGWSGGLHEDGWAWEEFVQVPVQVARHSNVCEIAISQHVLEEQSGTPIEEFSIGVTVSQDWSWVGVLPNTNPTDENPRGMAPMLALNGENNAPLPPVGPVDPIEPEVSVVGLIGDFNNWSDDLIMYDNGEGWYVAQLYVDAYSRFKFRLDRTWDKCFGISGVADNTAYPGILYDLENGGGDIIIPVSGDITVYLSDDFTQFKYEAESAADAGDGTEANPYDAAEAYNLAATLADGEKITGVYVKGTIVEIYEVSTTYGNATYYITDESGSARFYVYRGYALGNNKFTSTDQIKVGDEVLIYGDLMSYKGNSPQLGSGNYIVELSSGSEEEYSLDAAQWVADVDGVQVLFDFGLAEEGLLCIALPSMDGTEFYLHMTGFYELIPNTGNSGVIGFTQYDWEWDEMLEYQEFTYSGLTDKYVGIVCESVFGVADSVLFTKVSYPYEIKVPDGGDDPQGPVANGWYRLYNSGKVMAPLAVGVTSGNAPASSAVNADENMFLFTYDPDMTGYTVQDVYGRYYGQVDMGYDAEGCGIAEITVSETLPSGDDYYNYLWVVDNSYDDGTTDVYQLSWYCGFGYSSADDYWYLSEATYEIAELRPVLVPARVILPETTPVVPEGKTLTLTNEEICAALTSTSTSYADYTIESASGLWEVNASQLSSNTFLQCRGKKGAYIKTPLFENDIKSVTIHFSEAKTVYANNVYCAFPSTWTVPTADAAYPEDGNVGRAVTDGSYSLTIPVDAGNNQVYISFIGTYAYYLDHIDVAF